MYNKSISIKNNLLYFVEKAYTNMILALLSIKLLDSISVEIFIILHCNFKKK